MRAESTPGARGPVFCGVDTHADSHWLCVLDWRGRRVLSRQFPADAAGYEALAGAIAAAGEPACVAMEGTSSYGAGLTRHLASLGMPVRGLATLMWTVPGGARETGGPYMRDPRHPRHFTDEFKRQIVDLYNAGKPKREIMDEYDLGKSTVERWIKSINATGSPRAACNRTPEQNRILELERENRRLRMEVDVLKQAALIYARK